MMGCLRTHVRKQPIIELYFESETVLKLCNLKVLAILFFKKKKKNRLSSFSVILCFILLTMVKKIMSPLAFELLYFRVRHNTPLFSKNVQGQIREYEVYVMAAGNLWHI